MPDTGECESTLMTSQHSTLAKQRVTHKDCMSRKFTVGGNIPLTLVDINLSIRMFGDVGTVPLIDTFVMILWNTCKSTAGVGSVTIFRVRPGSGPTWLAMCRKVQQPNDCLHRIDCIRKVNIGSGRTFEMLTACLIRGDLPTRQAACLSIRCSPFF